MRLSSLTAVILATVTIAACGSSDSSSDAATGAASVPAATATGAASVPAATATEVSDRAAALTRQTRSLQEDLTATARSLVADTDHSGRQAARGQLERQQARARQLAAQAKRELPAGDPARLALVQANDGVARAAGALRTYAGTGQAAALGRARSELKRSQVKLGSAAGRLLDRAPADVRKALEKARTGLPAIPRP